MKNNNSNKNIGEQYDISNDMRIEIERFSMTHCNIELFEEASCVDGDQSFTLWLQRLPSFWHLKIYLLDSQLIL